MMSFLDVINQRLMRRKKKLIKAHKSYLIILPKEIIPEKFMHKPFIISILSLTPDEIVIKLRVVNGNSKECNKNNKGCRNDA